jgi:hypothetical protein
VLAFSWAREFDEKALYKSLAEFRPELEKRDKMNIYVEMHRIDGVEAKAIWEDVKYGFSEMPEITEKVDKVAFVTDKGWLQTLSELTYKLIPGVDLKAFDFDDAEAAREWVSK